jgi:hypothetical protein
LRPNNLEIRYNEVSILQAEGKSGEGESNFLQDVLTQTEKRSLQPAGTR